MKQVVALTIGLFMAVLSGSALALEKSSFYLGLEVGNSKTEVGASLRHPRGDGRADTFTQRVSEAPSYSFYGGYNFSNFLSIERQFYTFTQSDDILAKQINVSSKASGIFLGFGVGEEVSFQLLLGIGASTIDVESKSGVSQSNSKTSYSYGVRVGKKIGPGDFTLSYMRYPDVIFDRNKFEAATAVGNNGVVGNLGGARLNRRIKFESLSVGYRFNF